MSFSKFMSQKLNINLSSYKTILFAALIMRILAAIFSEGFGMHDDHYLTIEASSSWVDGFDYNDWLPWTKGNKGMPEGHSFTYVGLNYIFFYLCDIVGIEDPKILMLFNRLAHAMLSMLVVYFGIKITEKISSRKNALTVGWILALLSIMPFLAVRNLVELTSIPFLLWGVWLLIKNDNKRNFLYAGLLIGLAISFRYQIAVFAIGIMMYYFFNGKFKNFFIFSFGTFITFALTQGVVDFCIWGYPFAEFYTYATYNMDQGVQYLPNSNYFMYLWVLMGVLLFPFGPLVAIGFFKSAKKHFLIFLPTIIFILFHTFYPNRQERFVLSVLPFFIILGVVGFQELKEKEFWNKTWNLSYKIFWILNTPLLILLTFTYTKMSRVESMYAIYGNKMENERILLEGSSVTKPPMLPNFYAKSWYCDFVQRTDTILPLDVIKGVRYDYIYFFGDEELTKRIKQYKNIYPKMELLKKCEPSLVDKIAKKINPRNSNEYIEVWVTHEPLLKK
jgi:hypothetical protein